LHCFYCLELNKFHFPYFSSILSIAILSKSKHLIAVLTAESESMGQKLRLHFRKGTSNNDMINAFGYEAMKTINLVAARQF
jgi:hypothetical protein